MIDPEEIAGGRNGGEGVMVKYSQAIIAAIIMGLLSWVGYSVADLRTTVVKLEFQLNALQQQTVQASDDRFRGSDWRREKERLDERFIALKERVEKGADRLDKMEREQDRLHGGRLK